MNRDHRPPDDPNAGHPIAWAVITLLLLTLAGSVLAVIGGIVATATGLPVMVTTITVLVGTPLVGVGVLIAGGKLSDRARAREARRLADEAAADRPLRSPRRSMRLRLRLTDRPLVLVLTDTPRPTCPYCHGDGGWEEPYGGEDGEYAGEHSFRCDCWTSWHRTLLRLPRRAAALADRRAARRAARSGFSDEPPF